MRLRARIRRLEAAAGIGATNQIALWIIHDEGASPEEIHRLKSEVLQEHFGEPAAPADVGILWLMIVFVTP
jgi:hypothetical protein